MGRLNFPDGRRTTVHSRPANGYHSWECRWNLNTGIIAAVGPILANQDNGRELTAASIQGNTKKNFLDLKAPVQFKLEQDDAIVNGGMDHL